MLQRRLNQIGSGKQFVTWISPGESVDVVGPAGLEQLIVDMVQK